MNKKTIFLALVFAALLIGTSLGYAIYTMTSNTISGTPTPQATLSLAINNPTPLVGETVTLTAHVSDNTVGVPITLTNNGVTVATVNTDASGNAVFQVVVNSAFSFVATGTHP